MKGLEHLINAARELQELGVDFELRIAGSGSRQCGLERQVKSLGLGQRVRFLGFVWDMPTFYRSVDVLALPSVSTEGLPLVVLEAMAMGVPVVATRLAGAPEVIEDGVNGLLVPPGEAHALARALSRLAADGELRERLGKAGQSHVRREFSVERVATEVTQVYRTVLDREPFSQAEPRHCEA
jgi:glycosyltransferase involved in cell wall biosynthesis